MAAQKFSSLPIYSLRLVKDKTLKYPLFQVDSSNIAAQVFQAYLQDRATEHVAVLLLDGQNNFLGIVTVALGGISRTHVSARDVITPVIAGRANAFIVGHNHPSGEVSPSPEDKDFTDSVKKAGELMGCTLLDHIIVSSGLNKAYYSFLDSGIL